MGIANDLIRIEDSKNNLRTWMQLSNYNPPIDAKLDELIDLLTLKNSLGLYVDFDNNVFTRVGACEKWSAGSDFTDFSFYGQIRRCTLSDTGDLVAYYGDHNYIEDGSNGQVMVEIPKFYYKVDIIKTTQVNSIQHIISQAYYWVSPVPLTGFKVHPAFLKNGEELDHIYIGAYEGCLWSGSTSSYVTDNTQTLNSEFDKFSSVSGVKPASGIVGQSPLTNYNLYRVCCNRGPGWLPMGVLEINAIRLLYIIEYASFNSQLSLGQGVCNIGNTSNTNQALYTGSTSYLGNLSGSALSSYDIYNGATQTYTLDGQVSISYRGMENLWGNIWENIHGLVIGGDGTQTLKKAYVNTSRTYIDIGSISTVEELYSYGYSPTTYHLPIGGYFNAFLYEPSFDWIFLPGRIGGDSVYPIGDMCYSNSEQNFKGLIVPYSTGGWSFTSGVGIFLLYYNTHDASYTAANLGGRLSYVG